MRVAVRRRLGAELSDVVVVAFQGLGAVGLALCELLHAEKVRMLVSEPRLDVAARAAARLGAEVMEMPELLRARADVFAPCALGGVLNHETVPTLRATVVCGAANNQLSSDLAAEHLADRGILYAPDFLVNAGGIINVGAEHFGWGEQEARTRVERIGPRLLRVLTAAEERGILPHRAARSMALKRIAAATRPPLAAA